MHCGGDGGRPGKMSERDQHLFPDGRPALTATAIGVKNKWFKKTDGSGSVSSLCTSNGGRQNATETSSSASGCAVSARRFIVVQCFSASGEECRIQRLATMVVVAGVCVVSTVS